MKDIFGDKTISIQVIDEMWSNWEKKTTAVELVRNGHPIKFHCINEDHCTQFALKLTQLIIAHTVNPLKVI